MEDKKYLGYSICEKAFVYELLNGRKMYKYLDGRIKVVDYIK